MEPLLVIVAAASAILFSYLGYLAGNYFPVIRREPGSGQTASGEKLMEKMKELFNSFLERREKQVSDDITPADEPPEITTPPLPVQNKGIQLNNPQETIQVWHDRKTSRIVAQIKGKQYDLDQPISPDTHGRLSMLMIDLQDKVGLGAEIKTKINQQLEKADEFKKPSFNPMKSLLDYVKADVPKIEEKTESIPDQINAILQQQIKGTPLDGKGISMSEWPGRGVVIMVGLDTYDDIQDIPDSSIRNAIRLAVKAWEEKKTEGKK